MLLSARVCFSAIYIITHEGSVTLIKNFNIFDFFYYSLIFKGTNKKGNISLHATFTTPGLQSVRANPLVKILLSLREISRTFQCNIRVQLVKFLLADLAFIQHFT